MRNLIFALDFAGMLPAITFIVVNRCRGRFNFGFISLRPFLFPSQCTFPLGQPGVDVASYLLKCKIGDRPPTTVLHKQPKAPLSAARPRSSSIDKARPLWSRPMRLKGNFPSFKEAETLKKAAPTSKPKEKNPSCDESTGAVEKAQTSVPEACLNAWERNILENIESLPSLDFDLGDL